MKKKILKSLEKFKSLSLAANQQKKVKGGTDEDADIIIEETIEN